MSAAGYSGTPLWKKLVVSAGDQLLLIDAPGGWRIPNLPDGVCTSSESSERPGNTPADTIIAFFANLAALRTGIPLLAPRIFPAGGIWAAWPRRAGGHTSDIRDEDIRTVALPLGLVDVKVAAIDADWSGLRLVWRVELRDGAGPPEHRAD
jgi:hypothetical protein